MAIKSSSPKSTNPLIAKIDQLFNRDLALENDYLRQENRILRSKFGRRVPLTEADRRILVKYGLRVTVLVGTLNADRPRHDAVILAQANELLVEPPARSTTSHPVRGCAAVVHTQLGGHLPQPTHGCLKALPARQVLATQYRQHILGAGGCGCGWQWAIAQ